MRGEGVNLIWGGGGGLWDCMGGCGGGGPP